MSTLHTLNAPPASSVLEACRPLLSEGDALLLIEDGVLHATTSPTALQLPPNIKCYALKEDCQARGLLNRCDESFEIIDSAAFVDLCVHHDKTIAWF